MQKRRSRFPFVLVLGVVALALGLIGYLLPLPEPADKITEGWLERFSNALYSTLLLFAFGGDVDKNTHSLVHIARLLAIATVSTAILSLMWRQIQQRWWLFGSRRLSGHMIILGLGNRGLQFARDSKNSKSFTGDIVVVDPHVQAAYREQLRSLNVTVIEGSGQDTALLAKLRVDRAKMVIAVAPDDASNIEIAHAITHVLAGEAGIDYESSAFTSGFYRGIDAIARLLVTLQELFETKIKPFFSKLIAAKKVLPATDDSDDNKPSVINLFLQVDDAQLRQSLRDHDRVLQNAPKQLLIEPFSASELVAAAWLRNAELHSRAILRGESHLHLLVMGLNAMSIEIIHRLLRIAPCPGFKKLRLTLLLSDVADEEKDLPESESLDRLLADFPKLKDLCDLNVKRYRPLLDRLDDKMLRGIEANSSVSAVLICLANDTLSSTVALRLRDATRRYDFWRAPIYVYVNKRSGLESAICTADIAKRMSDVVEPFGTLDSACTIDALVQSRDRLPRLIHESYLKSKTSTPEEQNDTNQLPWDELPEILRSANRRQADHIAVKFAYLALSRVNDKHDFSVPNGFSYNLEYDQREQLAQAEHDSWNNDRWLDGWRQSEIRDEKRLLHTTLVDFKDLEEKYKNYDRKAIDWLCSSKLMQASDAPAWRPEHKIALIGHNNLKPVEAQYAEYQMRSRVLKDVLERHPHHLLSFFTPLAPGSDLILTQTLLSDIDEQIEKLNWSGQYRLIMLEAVPRECVLDDYQQAFELGAWPDDKPHWQNNRDWSAARETLLEQMSEVEANEKTEWILELSKCGYNPIHWQDAIARQEGYIHSSQWIAQHADEIVAVVDRRRDAEVGGTLSTLSDVQTLSPTTVICRIELADL